MRIARLTRALTMLESPASRARAIGALQQKPGFDNAAPWEAAVRAEPRYASLLQDKPQLTRSVILKAPGPHGEKGVLLMTFEYNWARLLLGLDAAQRRWMDANYDLVLSTSWSPTDYAVLGLAAACTTGDVFVQSCNYGEIPENK